SWPSRRPTVALASPRYHSFASHWAWNRSALSFQWSTSWLSSFTTSDIWTLMVRTSASVTAQASVISYVSVSRELGRSTAERWGLGDGMDESDDSRGSRSAEARSTAC